jgi:K(+)-stimulated pyrophosphate-energized sodium pump
MISSLIIAFGVLALLVAVWFRMQIKKINVSEGLDEKTSKQMLKISGAIEEGAMTFLKVEYKYISYFVLGFAVLIVLLLDDHHTPFHDGYFTAGSFIFGAIISLVAGYNGMKIAVITNYRTTVEAKDSLSKAFKAAFYGGSVMGFVLVGIAVLGMILTVLLYMELLPGVDMHFVMEVVAGFGLGGSTVALFSRVGGGIYTKAADVGADLSGKVENSIPEDDPRNPAVIADNVGDNVGDIAGMGADLFGSAAEATSAALVIGASAAAIAGDFNALIYPIMITAIGVIVSIITVFFAKVKTDKDVEPALKNQLNISTVLMAVALYFITDIFMVEKFTILGKEITKMAVYWSFIAGLVSGLVIGYITEFYTSHSYKPVREVSDSSKTGAATNIIYGLALGYKSTILPVIFLTATIVIGYSFAGMYGIAIAAIGMISTLATALTIDAYGPIADNAGGIAEMCEMGDDVRDRTDNLDAAGNTTAAIGKGFAIGSAALTSLALFAAFITRSSAIKDVNVDILQPWVAGGLVFGAMLPYWFSAMTMKSVGKAALDMVEEVRRQFKSMPGILKGEQEPDYAACVNISTTAALREMIGPGILVVFTPILVGYAFGTEALAGVLAGALVSGVSLAISSANSGGAWDNAKKYIEKGALGEGHAKGSDTHKAAVVGDTVGDPFKDTSGPSINILIKLMAIISLVFASSIATNGGILLNLF